MKVLQLFNRYLERGGEEKSAERIFQHARDVAKMDRLWWDSSDWTGPSGPGKIAQLRKLFCNEQSALELRDKMSRFQPDALLCHNLYPVGSPVVYREALRANVPVIQFVHNFRPFSVGGSLWTGSRIAVESLKGNYRGEVLAGAWQDSVLKSGIFALLLKRLHASGWLDSIKCWVCISEFMRERFIQAGLPPDRVVTLRHSWDKRVAEPDGRDEGYYLFLSRLVPEKGVEVLLEAWLKLWEQLGDRAPLLKIGGTGPQEQKVKKLSRQCPKIEYLGFVSGEQKEALISGCRAMMAPSIWWEPLGLVTYEAYDYGKPMLAASSGGLTETVQDGVTGLLFRPNDAVELSSAVSKLEAMPPQGRREMGSNGRAWLDARANPDMWKKSFAQILKGVSS